MHASWAGQDAVNSRISLCPTQLLEFGPEPFTLDLDHTHQNTTWKSQKNEGVSREFDEFRVFVQACSKSRVKISGPSPK